MRDRVPVLIGSVIGLALSGYVLFYRPMHRNYEQCGHITLCASVDRSPEGQDGETRLDAKHESAVPQGDAPAQQVDHD